MRNVGRKLAFVLAASNHGTMIVNRFDYRMTGPDSGVGVGYQLLEAGATDPVGVELGLQLIEARRRVHGDEVWHLISAPILESTPSDWPPRWRAGARASPA